MKPIFSRLLTLLLLTALLLLSLAACGNSGEDELPENMQYATVDGAYYRLFVPTDWNLMTGMGISGAYASTQNYAAVFVRDYDNSDALTSEEYAKSVRMPDITAVYSDNQLGAIACSNTVLAGQAACLLEYTGTRDLVTYHAREIVCAYEGRVLVLTYITQMDLFDGYLSVYDSVTANFKFSDQPYVADTPVNTVNTAAPAPDGMILASNDDVAYRFYVPDTWTLNTALPTSSAYVSETDRSNVGVTVYMPEVDQMTAEEYWAQCEAEYITVMNDYTLLSTASGTLDGRPANTYIYSADIGGTTYRFAQTVATYRGMVYTVTYTALDEMFDNHMAAYEQIIAAFDFRGN